MESKRVVVTGLDAITPIGNTVKVFLKGLVNGKSGAGEITRFDSALYKTLFACEVKTYDPENCDFDEVGVVMTSSNKAKKRNINYALSNSFGFGGQSATLIFKKFQS